MPQILIENLKGGALLVQRGASFSVDATLERFILSEYILRLNYSVSESSESTFLHIVPR